MFSFTSHCPHLSSHQSRPQTAEACCPQEAVEGVEPGVAEAEEEEGALQSSSEEVVAEEEEGAGEE